MGHDEDDHRETEPDADRSAEDEGYDADEQRRRAAQQEQHRSDARSFFEAAPPYRIQFEDRGTVSLLRKGYEYWPNRPPAGATRWRLISEHADLEQAERRLRHVTSPPIYYDERGQLAQAPPRE